MENNIEKWVCKALGNSLFTRIELRKWYKTRLYKNQNGRDKIELKDKKTGVILGYAVRYWAYRGQTFA